MEKNIYGWCGKILKINLSDSGIETLPTMEYADRFLGGRGIATRIYWENVSPRISAFDPENHLIFMTGPLGATGAQGASRFIVAAKSPMLMPEGFCYGNMGSFFGPYLKRAGYDGIVISGKSENPVYLWINENSVEIQNASSLWGKGVYEVGTALKKLHGKESRFITTGVAGENLCRTATILTDNEGSSTGGFGAVMGSKNLKAIVVLGNKNTNVARPEELQVLNKKVFNSNRNRSQGIPFPGGPLPVSGQASCYQCGLDCQLRKSYRKSSGQTVVRKCQSMFVYFQYVMRSPEKSLDTAFDATGLCNDLSICTMEMSNVLEWLETAHKSGYITEKESGIDISKMGSSDFFKDLTYMIAHREGFGDILAEGLLRAGEKLGPEARDLFSTNVTGVGSGSAYSGREYIMNGLLYAFSPRQPIGALHEVCKLVQLWLMNQSNPDSSQVSSDVFRSVADRFWGSEEAGDLTSYKGKALAASRIIDRTLVKDSLMLCDSNWPIMTSMNTLDNVGDPDLESKIFNAVTGIETDETGLRQYGEQIFNQERAILLREGWRPKEDDYPNEFNFTEPIETALFNPDVLVPGPGGTVASRKGKTLNREKYEEMRKEFYALRNWNPDTGIQQTETLKNLGLPDVALELKKLSLIDERGY